MPSPKRRRPRVHRDGRTRPVMVGERASEISRERDALTTAALAARAADRWQVAIEQGCSLSDTIALGNALARHTLALSTLLADAYAVGRPNLDEIAQREREQLAGNA